RCPRRGHLPSCCKFQSNGSTPSRRAIASSQPEKRRPGIGKHARNQVFLTASSPVPPMVPGPEPRRMVSPTPPPKPNEPAPPHLNEVGALRALLTAIRTRIMSGLILALPIVLTFWIIYWLYTTLTQAVLDPLTQAMGPLFRSPLAQTLWWRRFVNPLIAI